MSEESGNNQVVRILDAYQAMCGVMGVLLLLATWPLWQSQAEFPQIPLVGKLPWIGSPGDWPGAINGATGLLMIAGFGCMTLASAGRLFPRYSTVNSKWYAYVRYGVLLFPVSFLVAVLMDQHRLQPWAIQFFALSFLFFGHWPARGEWSGATELSGLWRIQLARLLVIGIYFWSALGKLDYQFAYTVGQELLLVPADWLGLNLQDTNKDLLAAVALSLPIGEMVAAALLCFRKSRRAGVWLITLMHIGLLGILGPLGLGHLPGVLLWNLFSIFQVWLLLGEGPSARAIVGIGNGTDTDTDSGTGTGTHSSRVGYPVYTACLFGLMLLLPIGERWGYYDHWPSWALYAPHSSRVTLVVPVAAVASLPASLQELIAAQPGADMYVHVPLDRWSLERLRVPIYPQSRFQLGVAIAVTQQAGLDREARLDLRGPASRVTGERRTERLNGIYAMKKASEQFWLNALP